MHHGRLVPKTSFCLLQRQSMISRTPRCLLFSSQPNSSTTFGNQRSTLCIPTTSSVVSNVQHHHRYQQPRRRDCSVFHSSESVSSNSRVAYYSTSSSPPSSDNSQDPTTLPPSDESDSSKDNKTEATEEQSSDGVDDAEIVLFHNPVNTSERLMRSGLGFATLHTLYWSWYTTDFIPTVNAAAMVELHINPVIGYGGVVFAAIIQAAFVWYPYRLVSKLTYQPQRHKILVYTHRIPLMRPNLLPSASFPVGNDDANRESLEARHDGGTSSGSSSTSQSTSTTKRRYFKLDASSPYAIHIVNDLKGDLTQYRGSLTVGPPGLAFWLRYTMQIQSRDQVVEPELLLQALLQPERFKGDGSVITNEFESGTASASFTDKEYEQQGTKTAVFRRNNNNPTSPRSKKGRPKQRNRR